MHYFQPYQGYGYHGAASVWHMSGYGDSGFADAATDPAVAEGEQQVSVGALAAAASSSAGQALQASGGGKAITSAGAGLSTASAVGGLLASSGVAMGSVVGVPVGVGLAAAAGIVAFVAHMRKGRMTRAQARKMIEKLHIKHGTDVLGWTRRVLQASPAKRKSMRRHLRAQIKRVKKTKGKSGIGKVWARVTNPSSLFRDTSREKLKLLVVNTVIDIDKAAARGMAEPPGPPPGVAPWEGLGLEGGLAGALPWLVGGALFFIVIAAVRR